MPRTSDLLAHDSSEPPAAQVRKAVVVNSPASATDDLFVVIPALDAEQKVGPCLWTPRDGDLPVDGDDCVVLDSADGVLHIVVWLEPH